MDNFAIMANFRFKEIFETKSQNKHCGGKEISYDFQPSQACSIGKLISTARRNLGSSLLITTNFCTGLFAAGGEGGECEAMVETVHCVNRSR
jgi:hypothetical protein